MRSCSSSGELAELGHLAEDGDGALPGAAICARVFSAAATESGLAL